MSQPNTPHTSEAWGAASRGYAGIAPRLMQPFAVALLERLQVGPEMHVLEVAAGTGALTIDLAAKAESVLATDFAPGMIEVLTERVADAGLENVRCELMDGQALDLEDASFDRAASSFAVMLFPERARGFSEMRRVLRDGGRAAVSGWAGPPEFDAFAVFLQALQTAFPDMPKPSGPPPVFSLADPEIFAAEMEAAGFREVVVDKVTRELVADGFDDLWGMLTVGAPPVKVLFDKVGEEGRGHVREALRELVAERYGDGPIRLSNTATVGSGVAR